MKKSVDVAKCPKCDSEFKFNTYLDKDIYECPRCHHMFKVKKENKK